MDAPYFPFYPRDWLSDGNVQVLSLEEAGAYITLLAYMWNGGKDCSLDDDDANLAKLLHVSLKRWKKLRSVLFDGSGAVFHVSDGRVRNKRLDAEWRAVLEKSANNTKAANKRWGKSERNADAMRTHSERNPITETDAEADPDPEKDLAATTKARVDDMTVPDFENEVERVLKVRMVNPGYKVLGRDYEALQKLLGEGVPRETILAGIDAAFDHHQPKHAEDKIRSLRYCLGAILDLWTESQSRAQVAVSIDKARGARSPRAPAQAAGAERDPRYANFYALFPEG
ncbi:DUF1376 domain-containing protein [Alicyclobacillus sp. ALC3]|uniref:DUF1376 domain-containing protein n=1 Tax=Alicyclobacillus sp. ALC3 TaxID=2796143 RepID=UPI002378B7A6|nr:DUF1376 domain-containing protein [Alicyclobacillus sp. ALC3]WDL99307.1 DUF1376 domain-containing protein [Alicyclobacillus sp. ALC3]